MEIRIKTDLTTEPVSTDEAKQFIKFAYDTVTDEVDLLEQLIKAVRTYIERSTGLTFSEKTIEANFSDRYSMHKVFQTTVFNYASNFSDFRKNFQSNPATLASLDKASDYVLNNFNNFLFTNKTKRFNLYILKFY